MHWDLDPGKMLHQCFIEDLASDLKIDRRVPTDDRCSEPPGLHVRHVAE